MTKKDIYLEQFLLGKLKSGDRDAFSSIFSTYYRDLVFFAYNFVHDPEIAEEIVQNTFIKLWEDHSILQINISLKSYLIRSVKNKCIDFYRHKKVRQIHVNNVINNSVMFENDTDNYILRSELEDQIESALNKLPPKFSEAFRMNRYEGLKYSEIAKKLNVSQRTVEVRIGKALVLLREYLKAYFPSNGVKM